MKKVFFLFVCILLIVNLAACATTITSFEFSQARENVTSVEIYHSEQAYYEGDIHLFCDENEPVAILEEDALVGCIDAIEQLKFQEEKTFLPIAMDGGYDYRGYMIVIQYADGGYDILAEGGLYSFAIGETGKDTHKYDHCDYCGDEDWSAFVEKYIER